MDFGIAGAHDLGGAAAKMEKTPRSARRARCRSDGDREIYQIRPMRREVSWQGRDGLRAGVFAQRPSREATKKHQATSIKTQTNSKYQFIKSSQRSEYRELSVFITAI